MVDKICYSLEKRDFSNYFRKKIDLKYPTRDCVEKIEIKIEFNEIFNTYYLLEDNNDDILLVDIEFFSSLNTLILYGFPISKLKIDDSSSKNLEIISLELSNLSNLDFLFNITHKDLIQEINVSNNKIEFNNEDLLKIKKFFPKLKKFNLSNDYLNCNLNYKNKFLDWEKFLNKDSDWSNYLDIFNVSGTKPLKGNLKYSINNKLKVYNYEYLMFFLFNIQQRLKNKEKQVAFLINKLNEKENNSNNKKNIFFENIYQFFLFLLSFFLFIISFILFFKTKKNKKNIKIDKVKNL